jgi:hypothetical protein
MFVVGAAAINSTAAVLARNNSENVMKSQNEWKGSASECEGSDRCLGEAMKQDGHPFLISMSWEKCVMCRVGQKPVMESIKGRGIQVVPQPSWPSIHSRS